tara:strand:- start:477 stop:677 length:201 start_codon:yes stop_codon:yes gene_type:complete
MITSTDQREQFQRTTDHMRKDTDSLKNAVATANETLGKAIETSAELQKQGDQMESMKDRVSPQFLA